MSKCSNCGIEFQCDIAEGKSSCWCFYVKARPHIPLHELDEDNCLCKDCLTGNSNGALRVLMNAVKKHK